MMMKRYHLCNQCREGKKSKVNSLCSFERGHSEVEGNSLRECFMTLEEEDSHILSVIRPVALRVCFKWLERKFYFRQMLLSSENVSSLQALCHKIFNFKFRNQLLKEKQQQVSVWYSRDIPVRMLCTSHAEFFKTAQSFQLLFE